jgi:hypothetical protein
MMKRYILGILKMMFTLLTIGLICRFSESLFIIITSSLLLLYTLSIDIILIYSGTAKEKIDGCKLKPNSTGRKIAFIISLLFGYTGIDRFLMTRWQFAFLKLALFIVSIICISEFTDDIAAILIGVPCVLILIYWWISDAITIKTTNYLHCRKIYLS